MAIFHLSVKSVSRRAADGQGRSATAAAAYRAGTLIACERENRIHDYRSRAHSVEASFILAPDGADWAHDRSCLWNAAERAERRRDAKVAREFELAIPAGLNARQRLVLMEKFARRVVDQFGVAVDVSIHRPSRAGDPRNHHAHILATTRRVDADGLGAKTRSLDCRATSGPLVESLREFWADLVNAALAHVGISECVDHRSNVRRGIGLLPTAHLGPAASARERQIVREQAGDGTRIGDHNRAVALRNVPLQMAHAALRREAAALADEIAVIQTAIEVEDAGAARAKRMAGARRRLGIGDPDPGCPVGLRIAERMGLYVGAVVTAPEATPATIAHVVASRTQPDSEEFHCDRDRRHIASRSGLTSGLVSGMPVPATVNTVAPTPASAPKCASAVDQAAENATREQKLLIALAGSIDVVNLIWDRGPRAGDALEFRSSTPASSGFALDDVVGQLVRSLDVPFAADPARPSDRVAYITAAALGAHRAALTADERGWFDVDLATARRQSADAAAQRRLVLEFDAMMSARAAQAVDNETAALRQKDPVFRAAHDEALGRRPWSPPIARRGVAGSLESAPIVPVPGIRPAAQTHTPTSIAPAQVSDHQGNTPRGSIVDVVHGGTVTGPPPAPVSSPAAAVAGSALPLTQSPVAREEPIVAAPVREVPAALCCQEQFSATPAPSSMPSASAPAPIVMPPAPLPPHMLASLAGAAGPSRHVDATNQARADLHNAKDTAAATAAAIEPPQAAPAFSPDPGPEQVLAAPVRPTTSSVEATARTPASIIVDIAATGAVVASDASGPTLRLYTSLAVHAGTPRNRSSPPGLHGFGPALAALGVNTKASIQVTSGHRLVQVLIDVAALAAALARLSEAEVLLWLERLNTAAKQSKLIWKMELRDRSLGAGGPARTRGGAEL